MIDMVLLLLCVPVTILMSFVAAELWAAGFLPGPPQKSRSDAPKPTVLVLIPAHNEALTIERCLDSLRPQLGRRDRLVVVADRCTDNTAELARASGAEVILRDGGGKVGKGAALNFGLARVGKIEADVTVVIDADCVAEEGVLDRLACLACSADRPVQGAYTIRSDPDRRSSRTDVGELAVFIKNVLRPAGLSRAAMPCLLTGSGMAWPAQHLGVAGFSEASLVEDMEIGIESALEGRPPVFCESARIWSTFPVEATPLAEQRKRWEYGHWSAIKRCAPRLVADLIRKPRLSNLALLLELIVPAFSTVLATWVAAVLTSVLFASPGLKESLVSCLVIAAALYTLGLLVSLRRYRKLDLVRHAVWAIPAHAVRQLWTSWRLMAGGADREWIKTKRS